MRKVSALIHGWLVLDFFGDARRSGGGSSTLTTTIFTQAFLALVFAALLYPETPRVPFAAANLCLSTLLIATGLLGNQDQLNRRRADETLLASAPIGTAAVVLARTGHAAFYVTILTTGMALPPAVLLAFLTGDWLQAPAYVALACACSGLASGGLGVTLRLLARVMGHANAALVAGTIKAMALGGGLVLFGLGMQRLQQTADALPIGRLGAELLPPYQAARVLADPDGEAWRLLVLLATAVVLLGLGMVIGSERSPRRVRVARIQPLRRLLQLLAGRGPTLGIAEFTALSMWRSPGFRARVLPLLGLPAGMVFLSLQGAEQRHGFVFTCLLLQLPAIYLPFLIAFLPRADQADTGWIFEQAPLLTRTIVHDATWRALVSHVLVPVHALGFVLLMVVAPSAATVAAVAFALALGVIASRAMIRTLPCVPFSQSRDGDTGTDLGSLFGSAILLGGLGTLFGGVLPPWAQWIAAALAIAGAVALLSRRPRAGAEVESFLPGPTHRSSSPEPESDKQDRAQEQVARAASLRSELKAIAVLYGAVCVLPMLIGTMFAV